MVRSSSPSQVLIAPGLSEYALCQPAVTILQRDRRIERPQLRAPAPRRGGERAPLQERLGEVQRILVVVCVAIDGQVRVDRLGRASRGIRGTAVRTASDRDLRRNGETQAPMSERALDVCVDVAHIDLHIEAAAHTSRRPGRDRRNAGRPHSAARRPVQLRDSVLMAISLGGPHAGLGRQRSRQAQGEWWVAHRANLDIALQLILGLVEARAPRAHHIVSPSRPSRRSVP